MGIEFKDKKCVEQVDTPGIQYKASILVGWLRLPHICDLVVSVAQFTRGGPSFIIGEGRVRIYVTLPTFY